MRSIKSGLVGIAITSLVGVFAAVGCTADGMSDDDLIDYTEEVEPTEPPSTLPTESPNRDDGDRYSGSDAGATKGGGDNTPKPDAGKEPPKAPPSPEPGDACTTIDQIVSRSCGMCGKQEAICQEVAGKLEWSDYGPCEKETGVCMPGDTEACTNCGTKTCSNYCQWSICAGSKTCAPGDVAYSKAGCSAGGYKSKTCSETCDWSAFTNTCDIPTTPNKMTILGTVGGVKSAQWTLQAEAITKPNGSCNGASSTSVRYIPVEVSNTTGKDAEISAFHTESPTGIEIDTVIWHYNGHSLPMSSDEIGACASKVQDGCAIASNPGESGSPCKGAGSLKLAGLDKITIPKNGKVLIYSALYGATTPAGDGTFMLNIRTDRLQ